MATSEAYNVDCMEYLKTVPDKFFDLAVVDPPYGGGRSQNIHVERESRTRASSVALESTRVPSSDASVDCLNATISVSRTGGTWATKYRTLTGGAFSNRELGDHFVPRGRGKRYQKVHGGADIRSWDVAPGKEYFNELARVSKNQVIWGGNYFSLPPTRCFLVWRKLTISENFTMSMAEYAWTSFNANAKVFEFAPQGKPGERFHPTQKPVELYTWIYKLFANPGDKILDTHLGSGSSRIAAWDAGLDFVGCEIDETYFRMEEERFANHTAQENLFLQMEQLKQEGF